MKRKCVVVANTTILQVGIDILCKELDVVVIDGINEDLIINCINENRAEALFVRMERVTRHVIESCPTLKVVQVHGIGVDNVDTDAASEHGVMVLNIPGGTAVAVSEHAMMMMFALSRDVLFQDRVFRGEAKLIPRSCSVLEGKNLFVVGLGHIGGRVARKMSGVGMNVKSYDKYLAKEVMQERGAEKVETLEEGLVWADVVSLHVPLTSETKHMISSKELGMMKQTALLINTARGNVVDEDALYSALTEGMIAGAGIDVFAVEPIAPDNPFLALDNVVLASHCGGASIESRPRPSTLGAQAIVSVMRGEMPGENLFNRQGIHELGTVPGI